MSGRRRRTAEESRSIILEVAAKRLREQGLEGLNITGVAEEAGISHATLIHHFGSSGGMRDALADKMTMDLIEDLVAELAAHVPTSELTQNVFKTLAEGGHAKLIAWRAVENSVENKEDVSATQEAFAKLLTSTQQAFDTDNPEEIKNVVYLVAIAAIGYGLAGSVLSQVLGMTEDDVTQFPQWLTEHLHVERSN